MTVVAKAVPSYTTSWVPCTVAATSATAGAFCFNGLDVGQAERRITAAVFHVGRNGDQIRADGVDLAGDRGGDAVADGHEGDDGATPMMTPSMVRMERSLLAVMLSRAVRKLSVKFMLR